MPATIGAEHLLGYLFNPGEAGIVMSGAMSAGPLTHTELRAWQENTDTRLVWWEAKFMVGLSNAYLQQCRKSAELGCPAPYGPPPPRDEVAEKIDQVFG